MGRHPGAADMSDMSDIDPDPAMAVAVTAALLDAGRVAAAIGHGSALLAGAALLATLPASGTTRLCCGLALALWPVSGWLALRVALDARLFATLDADEASFTRFDACLPALGLYPSQPGPRPLPLRCRGALRLWRSLLAVAGVQFALVLVAALARH